MFRDRLDDAVAWMLGVEDDNMFVGLLKIATSSVLLGGSLLGGGLAVLNHFANKNYREFTQVTAEIDHSRNLAFSSIDDCKLKGFSAQACKTGESKAKDWAGALGVSVGYDSMGECQKIHGKTCAEDTTTTTSYDTINNVMVPITTTDTTYTPGIIGWQAAISDFKKAVPLYASTTLHRAYRADGAYVPFK